MVERREACVRACRNEDNQNIVDQGTASNDISDSIHSGYYPNKHNELQFGYWGFWDRVNQDNIPITAVHIYELDGYLSTGRCYCYIDMVPNSESKCFNGDPALSQTSWTSYEVFKPEIIVLLTLKDTIY